ncbi:MAG: hypothetical protein ACRC2R_09205 [Xenococcaceae cyanobacterium]
MHKIFIAGLIALDTLLLSVVPVVAQEFNETRKCRAAIIAAKNRIENGRQIKIVYFDRRNLSSTYPDYPKNRPYQYVFGMEGAATNSIMNSSVLVKSVATQIINSCNSVSLVSFGPYATGWQETNGLMPDGSVKSFGCNDFNEYLKWGKQYCT